MRKKPLIAFLLSMLMPGLGQIYNSQRAKGVAMLCIALGIWFWFVMAAIGPAHVRSGFSQFVLAITYLFVWIPSIADAYRHDVSTRQSLITGQQAWYVILMVLMTGAVAIPLLWQSLRFSRTAKIVWSAIAILNTLCALLVLVVLGPAIEHLLNQLVGTLNELR